MSKFKVGDWVKCNNSSYTWFTKDKYYEIIGIDNYDNSYIYLRNENGKVYECRIENFIKYTGKKKIG